MLTKLFAGLFLSLGMLAAVAPADEKPADCCAQKLACCGKDRACCAAPTKLGCCEQGLACCGKDRACCAAVPDCCRTGAACCKEAKACCGPTPKKPDNPKCGCCGAVK